MKLPDYFEEWAGLLGLIVHPHVLEPFIKLFMTYLEGEFCFAIFPTFLYFLAYIFPKTDAI